MAPRRRSDGTYVGDLPPLRRVIPYLMRTRTESLVYFTQRIEVDGLLAWLEERIWPLEAAHDDESAYWCSLLGAAECLLSGTTTVQDIGLGPGIRGLLDALADSGLRAVAGKCLMDGGQGLPAALAEDTDRTLAETAELGHGFERRGGGRLSYVLNPRFLLTGSDELWRGIRELSERHGWPVHTHALEQREEGEAVIALKGRDEIEYFDQEGFLAGDLRMAHGVWLEDQHLARLAGHTVSVVHCPTANRSSRATLVRPANVSATRTCGRSTVSATSAPARSRSRTRAAYTWGTSELIEYTNADGQKLRAILTKPENFDPTKKYPLMVYIYEELSQGLHSFNNPGVGHSINIPRYVSNGYVMLRPDIVYTTGYPGEAAEKCVIPAVNTVVDMGFIDPKRIGIQGHSWGGYQITHLITRTNLFAAVQAGASVSNMISAYGGIRWQTGMSRAFQYEKTQSRIGAPPWDAPLQFIENSPIFWVKKIQTPYLTIHNDEDDAVPWYQGIEFITALRRLGKEGYLFNYNGERHGLRQRDNQKHWTVHMDEFFDHYLLGKPRPEWMDTGVPYLERGKRDVSPMFERKVTTTTPASAARR